MMRTSLLLSALLLAGAAQAQDGLTLGIGTDYSTGDYGSNTTTDIWSVPFTARLVAGEWTFKASMPWLRVSGDPNVLPGLGTVTNLNPGSGDRTATGFGDLALAASWTLPTGTPLGVQLTANAKLAIADEDKGLGTGANDYGVAVDLYRAFGATTWFGGAGYTWLGDSQFIDVEAVSNVNAGFSHAVGNGNLGLLYDWREAASSGFDDRSELTAFYGFPAGKSGRFQVYALRGLSDGSPDWGAGLSYSVTF